MLEGDHMDGISQFGGFGGSIELKVQDRHSDT